MHASPQTFTSAAVGSDLVAFVGPENGIVLGSSGGAAGKLRFWQEYVMVGSHLSFI